MAALSPLVVSPGLTAPPPQVTAQDLAKRARVREAAETFEAQFLSSMLQQMFAGVKTDGAFGGGFGEDMFRSVMTQAMAEKMSKAGGIGLADTVQREILKMQGLS